MNIQDVVYEILILGNKAVINDNTEYDTIYYPIYRYEDIETL